jgi:hypothetical protein
MQNEELPLSGYNYNCLVGDKIIYTFETNVGIIYEIKFKTTDYLFEESGLENYTYEMVIEVLVNQTGKTPSFDKATGLTVSAITNDFYKRSPLTTTIFICDDSDRRELARHRRFGTWFSAYNDGKFSKFDFEWKDSTDQKFYLSVIILANNPFAIMIKERFEILADAFRQDK